MPGSLDTPHWTKQWVDHAWQPPKSRPFRAPSQKPRKGLPTMVFSRILGQLPVLHKNPRKNHGFGLETMAFSRIFMQLPVLPKNPRKQHGFGLETMAFSRIEKAVASFAEKSAKKPWFGAQILAFSRGFLGKKRNFAQNTANELTCKYI